MEQKKMIELNDEMLENVVGGDGAHCNEIYQRINNFFLQRNISEEP